MYMKIILTSFWRHCRGIDNSHFGNSVINLYISFGLNKFLVPLPGTEKFLSGNTRSLTYTDHIIQFGLNKFLAPLLGTEKFLGGSTRSLAYTDHIIQFGGLCKQTFI